jgi:hypothetical protein
MPTFTTAQRQELVKKGLAKSDGSYPIRNKRDLVNAILDFGRSSHATDSDKAWIIKRARALGGINLLPPKWGIKS